MSRPVKLTPALLRRIVIEERARIVAEAKKGRRKKMKETDEPIVDIPKATDAADFADTLADPQNHHPSMKETYTRLSSRERQLLETLERIRDQKRRIRARISRR
jgi:hypothetical protein